MLLSLIKRASVRSFGKRHHAVYLHDELLAVTLYKRGALEVKRLLDALARQLEPSIAVPVRLVSGGQTGSDRAALDFALQHSIDHGGFCPKSRVAEDGPIPDCYQLKETSSTAYPPRTEQNVLTADATVIFSLMPQLEGGSRLTCQLAAKHHKPFLHLHGNTANPAQTLFLFLLRHRVRVLNVAGSRASKEPQIAAFVHQVLSEGFLPYLNL